MLNDPFGRHIEYLRLSITDRCDFRCFYCLPKSHRAFETPTDWLTVDELERLVEQFANLGVKHVRLTGGEPLVRKEVGEIAERISALPGIQELSLSTNGSRLTQLAASLHKAGIERLNISLDTLNEQRFHDITGSQLKPILEGIKRAKACGFSPIKINMVVMRGINDNEVEKMVDYCIKQGLTLRFIETMPVGDAGRSADKHYVSLTEIEERLRKRYKLQTAAMRGSGPARYFRIDDSPLVIGFITPKSQHFCDTCNRVRLSVTGDLHLCLGQQEKLALGSMMRSGASNQEICKAIRTAITRKPLKHHFVEAPSAIIRPMSALGG
ncbi:MAG: GTP 3',8-cyclase MoaA [Candidatus Thiodiazotropha sp.]|jgi:GTP 3',8-cyclase